jgi:hypothetical protein
MAIDFSRSRAVSTVKKTLRKVSGNLPGLAGILSGRGGDNSDFSGLNRKAKSPNMYSFPIDVTAAPGLGNHGHYMIFYVNQQSNAKLKFGEAESGSAQMEREEKNRNIPAYIKEMISDGSGKTDTKQSNELQKQVHSDMPVTAAGGPPNRNIKPKASGSTVFLKRPPTTRLDTAIALYMPPQVQVSYKSQYSDTPIGGGTAAAMDVYSAVMAGRGIESAMKTAINKGGQALKEGVKGQVLSMVGAVMPGMSGAREAFEIAEGYIQSDRMELAFKGIDKRAFSYTFKMIPRNDRESDEIRKIIFAFKANMLPEFKDGVRNGREMIMPNTFDIEYMYNGKENDYLHKISTCVLEDLQVTQGGSRYKTFTAKDDGAPPVETSITLSFRELELITRERVHEGF